MTQAKKNSNEEIAAPPMVDDRGFPLIVIGRLFPCMSNSDIAARAKVYGAWRAMTERDYMAGAGLTVRTSVREDPRERPKILDYVIGGAQRHDRSYAEMEAEIVAAVRRAHATARRE